MANQHDPYHEYQAFFEPDRAHRLTFPDVPGEQSSAKLHATNGKHSSQSVADDKPAQDALMDCYNG
jgi:hypothetical protein